MIGVQVASPDGRDDVVNAAVGGAFVTVTVTAEPRVMLGMATADGSTKVTF